MTQNTLPNTFPPPISDEEFSQFQSFISRRAGIYLSSAKKALVCSRLNRRLKTTGLGSFGAYYTLLEGGSDPDEVQLAVDLLTTNETYFFREPRHFDFLRTQLVQARERSSVYRFWSAACSSGEEPYSVAMMMSDLLSDRAWHIVASDISSRVLTKAVAGRYPLERLENIPKHYLPRFCLKGVGSQQGAFIVKTDLRRKVEFMQINLNDVIPHLGAFDMIFLRNVMIYFEQATKRRIVERVLRLLKPDGYFVVGHSESLHGVSDELVSVFPSIYQRK